MIVGIDLVLLRSLGAVVTVHGQDLDHVVQILDPVYRAQLVQGG